MGFYIFSGINNGAWFINMRGRSFSYNIKRYQSLTRALLGATFLSLTSTSLAHAQACGTPTNTGLGDNLTFIDFTGFNITSTPTNFPVTLPDGRNVTLRFTKTSGFDAEAIALNNNRPLRPFVQNANISGRIGLRSDKSGTQGTSFRLDISPPSTVFISDGEQLGIGGSLSEYIDATTNGGVWEQIDGTSANGDLDVTGLETPTVRMTGLDSRVQDVSIVVSRNASRLDIDLRSFGGGRTGVAFGFASTDTGDGPLSIGTAAHSVNEFTNCTAIGQDTIYLGTAKPDMERPSQVASANASGDNSDGPRSDEDGISTFPQLLTTDTTYSIPAANFTVNGNAALYGWIDFNLDGSFTANEFASQTVIGGVLSGPLDWPSASPVNAGRHMLVSGLHLSHSERLILRHLQRMVKSRITNLLLRNRNPLYL